MKDVERMKRGLDRRAMLRRAAVFAAAAPLLAFATQESVADEKLSQKDAEYQPTPKNGQSCATCQHFIAPSSCKLVKGKISPQGWCTFWGPKQ
jgi:High potential iron-sulfur protein